jgi:histidinol phosphatase-like enzyme
VSQPDPGGLVVVFLDRDGTLIEDFGHLDRIDPSRSFVVGDHWLDVRPAC